MNIIDLSLHPELCACASDALALHTEMRALGHSSYQLGPYTTNDVVEALREELRQLKIEKEKYQEEAWKYRDLCK